MDSELAHLEKALTARCLDVWENASREPSPTNAHTKLKLSKSPPFFFLKYQLIKTSSVGKIS